MYKKVPVPLSHRTIHNMIAPPNDHTGTKKQVFLTFITNYGITPNTYAQDIVDVEVRLGQIGIKPR
jgi:hypothetical protein